MWQENPQTGPGETPRGEVEQMLEAHTMPDLREVTTEGIKRFGLMRLD